MLYALLCYHSEDVVCSWSKEEDAAVMAKLGVVQERLTKAGKLGPVARLMPTTAATTLRKDHEPPLVIDGPFAETKEQLLGFFIIDCASLEEAIGIARELGERNPGGAYEIRPVSHVLARGQRQHVTDLDWIDAALTAARPRAVAALVRYFRDLDAAEEAVQNACLRALKTWPKNGPPRDPAAWLILVGRNLAVDTLAAPGATGAAPGRGDHLRRGRCRGRAGRAPRRGPLPRRHPAPPVRLLPSRVAGDAADRAGAAHRFRPRGQGDRARIPRQRERRWSSASPAPSAASRRRACPTRRPAPSSAPNASPPWRP